LYAEANLGVLLLYGEKFETVYLNTKFLRNVKL